MTKYNDSLTLKHRIGYALGDFGGCMTFSLMSAFMTRYYVCGDSWTVREIEPSTGYLLNDTVYEVGASPTLYEVELNRNENKITDRQGFQAVSRIVRDFVYAATGIKVQNYTLMEIHAVGLPLLYELISQCYIPEFAIESKANIYEVINKARTVISQWN